MPHILLFKNCSLASFPELKCFTFLSDVLMIVLLSAGILIQNTWCRGVNPEPLTEQAGAHPPSTDLGPLVSDRVMCSAPF